MSLVGKFRTAKAIVLSAKDALAETER